MKKIYESPLNGWDESAERIHVYALESDEEYWDVKYMRHDEKCAYFDVYEEPGHAIVPGGMYHRYDFNCSANHVVMTEIIAYNV